MESHLLQMRGLKPSAPVYTGAHCRSHLLQMRGLKPKSAQRHFKKRQSRIFYRCVD